MTTEANGARPGVAAQPRSRALARAMELWVVVPQWLRMLVPVAAMFLLWRLSAREPDQEPQSTMHSLLHNSMHVIAYGCLAASVWLAWSRKPVTAVHAFRSRGAWLIAAAYGVVDELHQSYVPGRVCSVADLASDAVGAALVILLLRAIAGIGPKSGLMVGALLCFAIGSVVGATFLGW